MCQGFTWSRIMSCYPQHACKQKQTHIHLTHTRTLLHTQDVRASTRKWSWSSVNTNSGPNAIPMLTPMLSQQSMTSFSSSTQPAHNALNSDSGSLQTTPCTLETHTSSGAGEAGASSSAAVDDPAFGTATAAAAAQQSTPYAFSSIAASVAKPKAGSYSSEDTLTQQQQHPQAQQQATALPSPFSAAQSQSRISTGPFQVPPILTQKKPSRLGRRPSTKASELPSPAVPLQPGALHQQLSSATLNASGSLEQQQQGQKQAEQLVLAVRDWMHLVCFCFYSFLR